jgi:hypothetical protein
MDAPTSYPPEAVAPPPWKPWEHTTGEGRRVTAESPLRLFWREYRDARADYRSRPEWTNGYALGLLHGHRIGHAAALKEKTR